MERLEAIEKLKLLTGKSLQALANEHGITIINENGRVNKGWAGHAIERYLELPLNSAKSPNFGSWELKTFLLNILEQWSTDYQRNYGYYNDRPNQCLPKRV